MKKSFSIKRNIILVIGLFIMSLGVALSVKANLGTSPVSCVPYVFSLGCPLSMGLISIIVNVAMILLQILILRKNYQLIQLLQLPVALIFGFFIDFAMFLESGIHASNYVLQWIYCLLSCVIIAFGVFLEVKANITYLAGEGLSLAISKAFKKEFGKVKVGVDVTLVVVGIISSILLLHKVEGIREGTIAAAILVGSIARFYSKHVRFVDQILGASSTVNITSQPAENKTNVIITIAREYGSGGHEIGEIIAKKMGIAFYDANLIDLSASESGLTPEYIKEHEQKLTNNLLFELYEQNYAYVNEEMPPLDTLFMVQTKVLRDICQKESCVIVGRCADYILKGYANCFNTFVHANKDYRIKRIIDEGIDPEQAERELEKKDRDRANYCKHYTHGIWGMAGNYDLTIDSSLFGSEMSANLIIDALNKSRSK